MAWSVCLQARRVLRCVGRSLERLPTSHHPDRPTITEKKLLKTHYLGEDWEHRIECGLDMLVLSSSNFCITFWSKAEMSLFIFAVHCARLSVVENQRRVFMLEIAAPLLYCVMIFKWTKEGHRFGQIWYCSMGQFWHLGLRMFQDCAHKMTQNAAGTCSIICQKHEVRGRTLYVLICPETNVS